MLIIKCIVRIEYQFKFIIVFVFINYKKNLQTFFKFMFKLNVNSLVISLYKRIFINELKSNNLYYFLIQYLIRYTKKEEKSLS